MSAPSSSGFCAIGMAKTLSITTSAPAACAISATAGISTRSSIGLDGDSKKTSLAGVASAARHWSKSVPSTNSVVTPQRGRMSFRIAYQAPNSARLASTRSTLSSWQASAAKTPTMPVPVARQVTAPLERRQPCLQHRDGRVAIA